MRPRRLYLWRVESGMAIMRRIAGRHRQRIALAQRKLQLDRTYRLANRRRSP